MSPALLYCFADTLSRLRWYESQVAALDFVQVDRVSEQGHVGRSIIQPIVPKCGISLQTRASRCVPKKGGLQVMVVLNYGHKHGKQTLAPARITRLP